MDNAIEWLKNDIQEVKTDMKEIRKDVAEMLQFKWQIIGGSVVISAVVGVLIQLLLAFKP